MKGDKIKSKFLTELEIVCVSEDLWRLNSPLEYESSLLGCKITAPKDFYTDLASVPRVPIAYWFYGGRAHREAVIHDYLFRKNSVPIVTCSQANKVFLEAMASRGKKKCVRYAMYAGVCLGGWTMFHKKNVEDIIKE